MNFFFNSEFVYWSSWLAGSRILTCSLSLIILVTT